MVSQKIRRLGPGLEASPGSAELGAVGPFRQACALLLALSPGSLYSFSLNAKSCRYARVPFLLQFVLHLSPAPETPAPDCQPSPSELWPQEERGRASLVAQWLRIFLLMQGTRVRALVWEDPTCRGATRPVSHNY